MHFPVNFPLKVCLFNFAPFTRFPLVCELTAYGTSNYLENYFHWNAV